MKKLITCTLLAIATLFVFAQENVIDLTNIEQEINTHGVPTLELVNKIGIEANKLYLDEKWSEAVKAYELYSKYCNLLKNLFYEVVGPYLESDIEARMLDLYYPDLTKEFNDLKNKYYYYMSSQIMASHRQGMCYFNMGNYNESLPLIIRSLETNKLNKNISTTGYEIWEEAKSALYSMIKYNKQ